MFIATRTKTGKEIQPDTKVATVSFLKKIIGEFDSELNFVCCGQCESIIFC